MAEPNSDGPPPHLPLGLYVLGLLRGAERAAVESHLARCLACRREAERLGRATDALALLTSQDVADLLAEPDQPDTSSS